MGLLQIDGNTEDRGQLSETYEQAGATKKKKSLN